VCENWVLRRIFGLKEGGSGRGMEKMHNEVLHDSHSFHGILLGGLDRRGI
jgi:hypothetical protein